MCFLPSYLLSDYYYNIHVNAQSDLRPLQFRQHADIDVKCIIYSIKIVISKPCHKMDLRIFTHNES
jgi:hypothetical protein